MCRRAGARQDETYQSVLGPGDALLLVGLRVGETLDLASLAAKEAVQVRANLVALTLLQVVALSATSLADRIRIALIRSLGVATVSVVATGFRIVP